MKSDAVFVLIMAIILLVIVGTKKKREEGWEPVHGDAHFASVKEGKQEKIFGGKGILLGYMKAGVQERELRFNADSHVTVCGATGTSKTSGIVIPNVLSLDHCSLIIADAKTDIFPTTIKHRAKLGPVYVDNPYGLHMEYAMGLPVSCHNPMAPLFDPREPERNRVPIAENLTNDCVVSEGDGFQGNYFTTKSREMCTGIMLAQAKFGREDEKHIGAVADIAGGDLISYFREMAAKGDPLITRHCEKFVRAFDRGDRSMGETINTLNGELRFANDPSVRENLSRSDYNPADLKKRISTVYVCVNLDFAPSSGKLLRLKLGGMFSALMRAKGNVPVVIIADEAFSYGTCEWMEAAYSMARAYNVRIMTIWTDLNALEHRYPGTRFKSILANSGAKVFVGGAQDPETAEYISTAAGITTIDSASLSKAYRSYWFGGRQLEDVGEGRNQQGRNLLLPHETALGRNQSLVFVRHLPVIWGYVKPYFKDPRYRSIAGVNPFHMKKKWFS